MLYLSSKTKKYCFSSLSSMAKSGVKPFLDQINSSFSEKTPTISPDGKYQFFGRDERSTEPGLSDIYWVSTEVIEQLRPKE